MQQITVLAVGKANGFYTEGIQQYSKRLSGLCRFNLCEIEEQKIDEKKASQATIQQALSREAQRILAAVPKGAQLVALCIEGKSLPTEEFAKTLQQAAVAGQGSLAFAIGSSHGLADEVKQQAALRLSLSPMTMPHLLARLVLLEQLYRAMMIDAGTSYHK